MYVPEIYRPPDRAWAVELVRDNPLALLVTDGPGGPYATHLPTVLPPLSGGELTGVRMHGHLNRANPHWPALAGAGRALLVFQGPHGYVSPTVYGTDPAAPTWNFTAVHLRGAVSVVSDREETLDVIRRTVAALERRAGTGWDMTRSLGYFDELLPGVGAFRLDVETVDCMVKLSQEKPAEVRERVIRAFRSSGRGLDRELAALMARL